MRHAVLCCVIQAYVAFRIDMAPTRTDNGNNIHGVVQ